MIFLDTSIALYAAGGEHPLKVPCRRILQAAARRPGLFVTNAEVFQELFHVARRQSKPLTGPTPLSGLADVLGDSVLPLQGRDVLDAVDLGAARERGLSSRDLTHLAVMQRHGIERIATADKDFDRLPDVERLDPARLAEWEDPAWFS
jgi:predicted nucleic acid-binding protein